MPVNAGLQTTCGGMGALRFCLWTNSSLTFGQVCFHVQTKWELRRLQNNNNDNDDNNVFNLHIIWLCSLFAELLTLQIMFASHFGKRSAFVTACVCVLLHVMVIMTKKGVRTEGAKREIGRTVISPG